MEEFKVGDIVEFNISSSNSWNDRVYGCCLRILDIEEDLSNPDPISLEVVWYYNNNNIQWDIGTRFAYRFGGIKHAVNFDIGL